MDVVLDFPIIEISFGCYGPSLVLFEIGNQSILRNGTMVENREVSGRDPEPWIMPKPDFPSVKNHNE